jgi:hypothetical protein
MSHPVRITFVPIPKFDFKGKERESITVLWEHIPQKGDMVDFSEALGPELDLVALDAPPVETNHIQGEVHEVCWFSAHEVQVSVKVLS